MPRKVKRLVNINKHIALNIDYIERIDYVPETGTINIWCTDQTHIPLRNATYNDYLALLARINDET